MTNKIETSVAFWEQIIKKRNYDDNDYALEASTYIKDKLRLACI